MTIFRSELVDVSKLTYQFVSSNDPDIIGIEVMLDGDVLIDISMGVTGATSVLFDADGGQMEFDLEDLRRVLAKCELDLIGWRERLMQSGEIWSGK